MEVGWTWDRLWDMDNWGNKGSISGEITYGSISTGEISVGKNKNDV